MATEDTAWEHYVDTTLSHAMVREYAYVDACAFVAGDHRRPWTNRKGDVKSSPLHKDLFQEDVFGLLFVKAKEESQKTGFHKGQVVFVRELRRAFEIFWLGQHVAAVYPYDLKENRQVIPENDGKEEAWTFLLEELIDYELLKRKGEEALAELRRFAGKGRAQVISFNQTIPRNNPQ